MKYTIVPKENAEAAGFSALTHRVVNNGTEMVLNENELLRIGNDVQEIAQSLGGELMSYAQTVNYINNHNE